MFNTPKNVALDQSPIWRSNKDFPTGLFLFRNLIELNVTPLDIATSSSQHSGRLYRITFAHDITYLVCP